MTEYLYDFLTLYKLFNEAVGRTQSRLLLLKEEGRFRAYKLGYDHHYAEKYQHQQRKQRTKYQHHYKHADNGHRRVYDLRKALRKHHSDRVRVVGEAAHYIAV